MKKILTTLALLLTAAWAEASLSQTWAVSPTGSQSQLVNPDGTASSGVIPIGPAGAAFTGDFTQATAGAPTIGSVTVDLNVTGGVASGFYAYLVAPNGTVVLLLNHPGTGLFGNPTIGLNVLLEDAGGAGIVNGSDLNPAGSPGAFTAAGTLAQFDGGAANGDWTLFFADTVSGGAGGTPTLNSWTLNITAVPEPVLTALVTFAAMLLALAGLKWAWRT